MAVIKPFRSIKPTKELASKVAALPYDVYNRKEACEVVKNNEYSFLRIDRAETQFDDSVDTYDNRVYAKAKELLEDMKTKGIYKKEDKPCYYVYELTMDGRVQTGIVACVSIDDYMNNIIKKHENTRTDKELDRIRHVDTCSAQTGPIFLAYRENNKINEVIARAKISEPIFSFIAEDGIGHVGYIIEDLDDITIIQNQFAGINEIYIADGHHRAASAVKVGCKRREENPNYTGKEEFNFFLSVLFQEQELMIMPYNRVAQDLNGLTQEEFICEVSRSFEVKKVGKTAFEPDKKGKIAMYLNGIWYELNAKQEILNEDAVKGLDVSLLQDYLLNSVLGIKNPKTDNRIDFIGGIRGLQELERRCAKDMKVAFAMYPTSIQELFAVSDAKKLMPPKSTWFEPKLRSGLFIHEI